MSVWEFLKYNMQQYGDKTALVCVNDKISYAQLIRQVESKVINKFMTGGAVVPVCDSNKMLQAIELLTVIAQNNVAVPISSEYGKLYCDSILQELAKNEIKVDEDIALILFTSGSSGRPKGVMLSHENIISNIKSIAEYFKINRDDKILIARPLMHAAVLTGEFFVSLIKGLTIEFYPESFNPARLISYIKNHAVTTLCGTPTMFNLVCKSLIKGNELPLRNLVISGERLSQGIAKLITDKFPNTDKYSVYGLTEASPRVSYLEPGMFSIKYGSIGKPIDGVEMKFNHDKNIKIIGEEIGRLWIKSTGIMRGYFRDSELTKNKIIDGWLETGDMGYRDTDGYYYISGRTDNMIIRAGMNIYPEEIEALLSEDERIEEILCYGNPDEFTGQLICVKVKGRVDKKYVRSLAKQKLPPHMLPNRIEIVDKIEKTASGKIIRAL